MVYILLPNFTATKRFPTLLYRLLTGDRLIDTPRNSIVASIGGSDSSAGAGVQGDIKTAAAMNAWCHTVVTAITAQTPASVSQVYPIPGTQVSAQLEALFTLEQGFSPKALKTGMLANSDIVDCLVKVLSPRRAIPLVVDTVFRATSGAELGKSDLPEHVLATLLPLATLVTPNLLEAAVLLNCEPATKPQEMRDQVEALRAKGISAVLLKGGHLPGKRVLDILSGPAGTQEFESDKIPCSHTHGSGCALATAISVGLARGFGLAQAVSEARIYVQRFIYSGSKYSLASRNGPLVHFDLH